MDEWQSCETPPGCREKRCCLSRGLSSSMERCQVQPGPRGSAGIQFCASCSVGILPLCPDVVLPAGGDEGSGAGSSSLAAERPQSFCQEHPILSAQWDVSWRCWAPKQAAVSWCSACREEEWAANCSVPCSSLSLGLLHAPFSLADCTPDAELQRLLPRNKKLQQSSGFSCQAATGSRDLWKWARRCRVPACRSCEAAPGHLLPCEVQKMPWS